MKNKFPTVSLASIRARRGDRNSMINIPAQKTDDRRTCRWLPSLSLLAVPLIMLSLPAFAPAPFAAKAFDLIPWYWAKCPPPNDNQYCQTYYPDGQRFMNYISGLIDGWMADHGLPTTERNVVLTYGREDLMADINGYIAAKLLRLVEKPQDKRTPDEQFVECCRNMSVPRNGPCTTMP
jgi:hypothetical protein